ncbi:hypothetical protein GCM10022254_13710 [Actinomadura meridiana]|uniref:Uncharacterized protein n=1 Tax=Actinomadura meridiana TaxID=559626 RepID=A0ABP8BVB3_9ACTN
MRGQRADHVHERGTFGGLGGAAASRELDQVAGRPVRDVGARCGLRIAGQARGEDAAELQHVPGLLGGHVHRVGVVRVPESRHGAEAEELHAVCGEHHLSGSQIAVHDPAGVDGHQCVSELCAQGYGVLSVRQPGVQAHREGLAVEMLGHHVRERLAVGAVRLAVVVGGHEVRVGERAAHTCAGACGFRVRRSSRR